LRNGTDLLPETGSRQNTFNHCESRQKGCNQQIDADQREYYLRLKLLEKVYELFKVKDSGEFTKESADVLEVILALASHHKVSWQEIEETRVKRAEGRGAFNDGVYLHAVYGKDEQLPAGANDGFLLNPFVVSTSSSPTLLQLLKQELSESLECRIASAFLTRGMMNLLKRPMEDYLTRNCTLQILTSTMNSFNNPDDLLHLKNMHPGLQLKVFSRSDGNPRAYGWARRSSPL